MSYCKLCKTTGGCAHTDTPFPYSTPAEMKRLERMLEEERKAHAAELDTLRARVKTLEAEVPYLKHLHLEGGEINVTIEGAKQVTALMAESLAQMFRDAGGVNYVQYEVRSGEHDYILLLQRAVGKTPHQLRQEAERERDKARGELEREMNAHAGTAAAHAALKAERDAWEASVRNLFDRAGLSSDAPQLAREVEVMLDSRERDLNEAEDRAEKAERERDEAVKKQAAMAEALTAETEAFREARRSLALLRTDRDGVWLWQGDGHDDITSLACPVVMSADTLRELLKERERDAARAEAAMLREALRGVLDALGEAVSEDDISVHDFDSGDAYARALREVRAQHAARAALAATPSDWLAARDRALAERVREACAQIPQHLATDDGHWQDLHERILATPLDALLGGKS